jgi:hypothetical protein
MHIVAFTIVCFAFVLLTSARSIVYYIPGATVDREIIDVVACASRSVLVLAPSAWRTNSPTITLTGSCVQRVWILTRNLTP